MSNFLREFFYMHITSRMINTVYGVKIMITFKKLIIIIIIIIIGHLQ